MKKSIIKGLALALVGAFLMAGSALATPTLQLSHWNGSSYTLDKTITDGSGTDSSGLAGQVGYNGTDPIGVFQNGGGTTLGITGNTKPFSPSSASYPQMDLNINVGGTTDSGQLKVEFSEVGFGPIAAGSFDSWLSSLQVATSTPVYQSPKSALIDLAIYYDTTDGGNTLFGTEHLLATFNGVDWNTGNLVDFEAFTVTSPFSLTMVATVNQRDKSAKETVIAALDPVAPDPVPEPASMLLLGSGLLGLAGASRLRKGQK